MNRLPSTSRTEENEQLRARITELEETLAAIRAGEVDALVDGEDLYTLESAESAVNRFRGQVLAQISDTVIAVDNEYRITYINEAAEKQYGVRSEDVLGQRLRAMYEYSWVRPEDEEAAMASIRETGTWRGENIHTRNDGSTLHVESVVRVMSDAQGQAIGYLAVMRDITERLRTQRALEEASRQKDHFLATLAHELRNPLSPLMNGMDLMEGADEETMIATRQMMQRQLNTMVRLVDDLMDISRISRGKMELRKEVTDLGRVVATAVEASRPLIARNGHELIIDLGEGAYWVEGDGMRLAQVISNLLNNAAKYTPNGGLIEVRLSHGKEGVLLCVKDNGIGISPQAIGRIFDMFAQVDGAMPGAGGLGIGLNIARRLTAMHGGSLTAHSDGPGKGCTFTLLLPATPEPADSGDHSVGSAHAHGKPARVLVVDDNRDGATSLMHLLRKAGHEVEVAFNGAEGLVKGEAFRPDIVLMDIGMPVMDGYEACKRMRMEAWGQRARIIAVSGWGQPQDRELSQQAGFDDHMVKPMERHTIDRMLASARR